MRNPWETVVRNRCDMLHVKLLPGHHNLFTVVVKRKLFAISWLLLYLCVVVVDVFDLLWNTCNGCGDVEQMSRHVSLITRNRSVDLNKLELTTGLVSAYRPGCSCYICMLQHRLPHLALKGLLFCFEACKFWRRERNFRNVQSKTDCMGVVTWPW